MSMRASPTRLVGATVVTQDDQGRVINDGEVSWDRYGVINYVGPARGPAGSGDLHLPGAIVMPGLVNAHSHAARTILRGFAETTRPQQWRRAVAARERRLSRQELHDSLTLALIEMIRSGTTTFADLYYWDSALLALVVKSGLRVLAAPLTVDYANVAFPAASPEDGLATLQRTEALAADFAGERQIRVAFGPHSTYACPPNHLSDIARRAQRLGLPVHIHVAETAAEVHDSVERVGVSPVAHAERLGLLDGPALVAHAVHVSEADLAILARRGAAVAHNPVSNLKLNAGVAPVRAMLRAGVPVGLGSDSVASADSLDLFDQVKLGAMIQRGTVGDGAQLGAGQVLGMATGMGAVAVGFPEVGTLEVGKWADVTVVGTESPQATPLYSPVTFLTFGAHGHDVRHVFVGGRQVLRDGFVTTLRQDAVRARVAASAARLANDDADDETSFD